MNPEAHRDRFAVNARLRVLSGAIGEEGNTVLFTDDVLQSPRSLVDFAASEAEFAPAWTAAGGYPGVRATAPEAYVRNLLDAVVPQIIGTYSLEGMRIARVDSYLSLVTRRPDETTVLQRIPHADTTDPLRIAFLHYFCSDTHGGTAFYQHRKTGYESLSPEREPEYLRARDRELATIEPPPDYIRSSGFCYDQTAVVDSRFNRLLIYQSKLLHSGFIPEDFAYSADPERGRLTANVFATFRPVCGQTNDKGV